MKTLIIHPEDRSTFFLDIVYKPIPDKTVITGGVSQDELRDMIADHDRVMMMGHGGPNGLFSVGQFTFKKGFGACIIDKTFVDVLSEKDNSVFIWCNADQFVERHMLEGFYSGMFISEVGEANYCGLPDASQSMVDESNYGFCNILAEVINEPQGQAYDMLMERYGSIAKTNEVAEYNCQRLYMAR